MVIRPYRTMRHTTITLLLNLFILVTGQSVALASEPPPLATVAALDVPRYMGRWYEIAKYPNRFQRKCVADTSAEYKLVPDGRVQVTNRCRMENGEWNEAVGMARQVGDASSPKLEVRFAPAWLSFIPAVWGDYWVIDLDPEYQLVAVSEPRREYLWVLSRTPVVERDALAALLERLRRLGFDTQRLEFTAHEPGTSRAEATGEHRVQFACDDDALVEMRYFPLQGVAVLVRHGNTIELQQQPSGSGFIYSNGPNTVRGKGDEIMIEIGRRVPINCKTR